MTEVAELATEPTVQELLGQLAVIRGALEEYAPILEELNGREKGIKADILHVMSEGSIERVRDHGLVVTKATRTTTQVGNMADIVAFLKEQGTLDKYTTIDTKRVIDDYGKETPGVRVMQTEYVSVRASGKD